MSERTYIARVVPLNRTLRVLDHGKEVWERFDDFSFRDTLREPSRVKVCLDHRKDLVVGHFENFAVAGDWLVGAFRLSDDDSGRAAADICRRGTPLSVSFIDMCSDELGQSGVLHRKIAKVREVSLTASPAYEGAAIIDVLEPPLKRTVRGPGVTGSPAAASSSVAGGTFEEARVAELAKKGILVRYFPAKITVR